MSGSSFLLGLHVSLDANSTNSAATVIYLPPITRVVVVVGCWNAL